MSCRDITTYTLGFLSPFEKVVLHGSENRERDPLHRMRTFTSIMNHERIELRREE